MSKVLTRSILFGFFCFSVAELYVRYAGYVDFPIYVADSRIGYIPKPGQSGNFMNKNDWVFNNMSMGTELPFETHADKIDILLVGDSVVLGGNLYRQLEKLGPILQAVSGAQVWPISASSWSLQNELQYIADHFETLEAVDRIVLVLNSGDFGSPSSWTSEYIHPRTRPVFATWYLFRKYVHPKRAETNSPLPVTSRDPFDELVRIANKFRKPIDIWLYPDRGQNLSTELWETSIAHPLARLRSTAPFNVTIHDGQTLFRLNADDYRDAIHPTGEANKKIAKAIAQTL